MKKSTSFLFFDKSTVIGVFWICWAMDGNGHRLPLLDFLALLQSCPRIWVTAPTFSMGSTLFSEEDRLQPCMRVCGKQVIAGLFC